jgi:tryptophan synthase alpha chain
MNELKSAFAKGKALMAFVTCGDPGLDTTAAVIRAAVEAGAGIIELNIPFSDPTAVDPVIQQSNIRALEKGITTDDVFDFIAGQLADLPVPLVLSTYANVVFSYGAERFAAKCAETGVSGLIVPDVPFEERMEFLPACKAHGVALISMLAVTSRQRAKAIAGEAEGFVYIMACPGTREQELADLTAQVRENTELPCIICLTGTEACRFEAVAAKTDGVAVDTPLVSLLARYGSEAPRYVAQLVKEMKEKL